MLLQSFVPMFETLEVRQLLTLAAPTGFSGTVLNPVAIQLSWQRSAQQRGSLLERQEPDGSWKVLSSKAGTSNYRDTNRRAGTTYSYRVRAWKALEVSPYTYVNVTIPAYDAGVNPATVAQPAAAPTGAKTLSITSYGATSNNSSNDDSAAFNSAMSAAKAGDTVYIPAGTFHLKSDNIVIKSGVNVAGAGSASSKLYATFGTAADQYVFTIAKGSADITVKDFSVYCSSGNVYSSALLMGSSTITSPVVNRVRVTGLHVEGFDNWAINVRNGQNVTIDNNRILNAAATGGGGEGYGINLNYDNTSRCWVHHNTIGSSDAGNYQIRHSILIQYRAHHNLIENNTSYNNVYDHYDLHGEDEYSNELRYNYASGSLSGVGFGLGNTGGTNPVHYNSGPNNWIHHNEVTGCEFGMEIINESDLQFIEDNNLHDNRLAGIRAYNGGGDLLYILRNTLTNNTKGIWLDASQNSWIEANTIHNNSGYGLLTTSTVSSYVILDNVFSGNGINWALANSLGEFRNGIFVFSETPIPLDEGQGVDTISPQPRPILK